MIGSWFHLKVLDTISLVIGNNEALNATWCNVMLYCVALHSILSHHIFSPVWAMLIDATWCIVMFIMLRYTLCYLIIYFHFCNGFSPVWPMLIDTV